MGIKAIVFDIGGVLIEESGVEERDYIAKKYGFDSKDFWEYTKKNLIKSYKGELRAEDFFNGLILELGLKNVDAEILINDWLNIREQTSRVDEVVNETIEQLGDKYFIGALSNSTKLNESVSARRDCYGVFDFKVLSCDVGVKKPEKKIYEVVINKLKEENIFPEETIFVDDKEENLVVAKEFGIKTILFKDSEQMIRDLRGMGVNI